MQRFMLDVKQKLPFSRYCKEKLAIPCFILFLGKPGFFWVGLFVSTLVAREAQGNRASAMARLSTISFNSSRQYPNSCHTEYNPLDLGNLFDLHSMLLPFGAACGSSAQLAAKYGIRVRSLRGPYVATYASSSRKLFIRLRRCPFCVL